MYTMYIVTVLLPSIDMSSPAFLKGEIGGRCISGEEESSAIISYGL